MSADWDDGGREHRLTPHAFSRFTFDRSGGALMVVDIQGCDDVYTDPQIHTLQGSDFGDGNLGVGGARPARGSYARSSSLPGITEARLRASSQIALFPRRLYPVCLFEGARPLIALL